MPFASATPWQSSLDTSRQFSKEFMTVDWPCPMTDRKLDEVVDFLIKTKQQLTLKNYLSVAYMGDKQTLSEVGPEDLAEIESLLEDAQIVDTESEEIN
jgi:hypothetical protein